MQAVCLPPAWRFLERVDPTAQLDATRERRLMMKTIWRKTLRIKGASRCLLVSAAGFLLAVPAFGQTGNSPWENAVSVLQQAFTSTIARGLSLVAIVVAGLTFAFGEGGSKRVLAGVLFGVGMAIAAVNFLAWLFPGAKPAVQTEQTYGAKQDESTEFIARCPGRSRSSGPSESSSSSPCASARPPSTCSAVCSADC